jgi:transcriptional regulator GlxA family with amidase domain
VLARDDGMLMFCCGQDSGRVEATTGTVARAAPVVRAAAAMLARAARFAAIVPPAMHIASLTFDGFNELDSLVALSVLCRVRAPVWRVTLACPTPTVRSMNGVTVHAQTSLADARAADAVLVGSGVRTCELAADPALLAQLRFDPIARDAAVRCEPIRGT